ncbi:MAG TPA: ATP-binding protein [Flavobacteriaceae bacterium]|nr:ATP-binding protein [Flavobacteriaceae bacterium]
MKGKALIALFCSLLLTITTAFGQDGPIALKDLRVKLYTSNDGLSQNIVNDVLKDSYEFSWIATEGAGLDRFDGTEFTNFKNNPLDSTTISGNEINTLLEDSKGDIWVGTLGNGLNRYNRQTNNFTRFKLYDSEEAETISDIVEDSKGRLWISTRYSGLYILSLSQDDRTLKNQQKYLKNISLAGLHIDKNEILWIGGRNGEVYKVQINAKLPFTIEKIAKIEGAIYTIFKKDNLLLLGSEKGLFLFNTITKKLRKLNTSSNSNEIGFVSSFLEEDKENIWVGTGIGLYLFNWKTSELNLVIDNSEEDQFRLSSNSVYGLDRISKDKILVGTTNGLNLLDFSKPFFYNISKDKRGLHLLNDNNVMTVLEESGRLWVGTADKGLNLIISNKPYYLIESNSYPKSLLGASIMDIKKDSINNRLWIATSRGLGMIELSDFSPNSPIIELFQHDENNINSISKDYLTGITIDNQGGVWGSTYGQGFFYLKYDKRGKIEVTRIKKDSVNLRESLANNYLYGSAFTDNKTLWIATEGGLSKLTFNDDNFTHFKVQNFYSDLEDPTSISHNSILSFLVDEKSRLWIGTRGGLNLYLGDGTFKNFNEDARLQGSIFTMQSGYNGDIWFGSTNGLFHYKNKTNKFDRYTTIDGLQANIIGLNASCSDNRGNLYFGGPGGLTYFSLNRLNQKDYITPVYFSGLRIKNIEIPFIDKSINLLSQTDVKSEVLEFNYDEFPFYIGLSKIDYNYYQGANYAFKLLPNDQEWNIIEDSEIQFLNLPRGDYTLMVNGFIRGREMDQPPIQLNLKIKSPWWFSWWAYSIYVIILLTIVLVLYRFNLKRQMAIKEVEKRQALDALKSKMFSNISHEFRTPLTMVKGLSTLLVKETTSKKNIELVKNIQNSNDQLLNLVNQMLDLAALDANKMEVHYKNGDIVKFVEKSVSLYRSYSDSKLQTISFRSEIKELIMDFDDDKLQKILNNLVSNAIKFTPEGGSIFVIVQIENNDLIIKVSDTGKGIEKANLIQVFDRHFKTYDVRGEEGSGIGLALTKELVELMEGDIKVESKEGTGSVFSVKLPIKNEALSTAIDFRIPFIKEPVDVRKVHHNTKKETKKHTVLIVEDNQDIQNFLTMLLATDYNIASAKNGIEGLEIASKKNIDFIISDVMMPEMDGFEFCKQIKANINTSHIPFIMISARTESIDKQKAYKLGVDAYLIKPFNSQELEIIIKNLLKKQEKRTLFLKELLHLKQDYKSTPDINELDLKLVKNLQVLILDDKNKLSINQLAKKLYISRAQLHRKLIALTGMSTTQYINYIKIEKAKYLLSTTNLTVKEIAYSIGFQSTTYFSKVFKKELGITPDSFRNSDK